MSASDPEPFAKAFSAGNLPLADLLETAHEPERPAVPDGYRFVSLSDQVIIEGPPGPPPPGGWCRVYWGSHGCHLERGHPDDVPHACDCCECEDHPDEDSGCVARPPYYGPDTRFYGEEAEALGLPGHEEA